MSGFNRSKRVLRLRPISNFAGVSPVIACGVMRKVMRKKFISLLFTLLHFFMAVLKLLTKRSASPLVRGDKVMTSHVSLHSVAEKP